MPDKKAMERAEKDKREGKSASTQAGEFVREEIHHIREGKHGARSTKQAIAIGLSEARRAGVKLPPPKEGRSSAETRRKAERDLEKGEQGTTSVSRRRAKATLGALKREDEAAASPAALARQGRSSASKRTPAERSAAARKGAQTKGAAGRSAAARKAAQTRARRRANG